MDFREYFATGEESPEKPDSLLDGDYKLVEKLGNMGDNSLSTTDKNISEDKMDLNEGLVDVVFKTLKTNMKVNVQGNLIYFKWEWIMNKTFFTMRVRKSTLKGFRDWINKIYEYAEEG